MGEHFEQQFREYLQEMDAYREAISLIHWDLRTKIPKKGVEQRSKVVGLFAQKLHDMQTSDVMKHFIDSLKDKNTDPIIKKAVAECEEIYLRNKKIPKDEYKEFVTLQSKSEAIWQEAREKDDFSLFQPYLEKIVQFNQKFASYWGYEDHIYDALLHNYEPGVTTRLLDEVFSSLRQSLSEILKKINESKNKPDTSIVKSHFPKESQKAFTVDILKEIGYDFEAGRLDETIHPFEITLNRNDVRITTRYDENDFQMAVFGTIHEMGHALYEQHIDATLAGTPLATGTSMGIHESQSLFWENYIGRSLSFWKKYYPLFQSYAPKHFQSVPLEDFYRAINKVTPSLIRIEADEVTYPFHIMVRFELEKGLINGDIAVKDLPGLWNEKMEEYLGIRVPTDREGVLQDIHWAGGDFGYFPSYALGLLYGAQFYHRLGEEVNINNAIQEGNFQPIIQWLERHIYRYGKMKKPLEILQDVTKEGLNPDYFIAYLREKYSKIY